MADGGKRDVRTQVGSIYRSLALRGIDALRADEHELWQLAEMLGTTTEAAPSSSGMAATLRRRLAGEDEPTAVVDVADLDGFGALVGAPVKG